MASADSLHGSCSCGRYTYVVHVPADITVRQQAHVHFGTGDFDRRSHASVLSAWLKVPLTWYQSTTISYFPDERHDNIARTFRSVEQPASQRKFCGFCGTHISYWTEQPENEQDFMNVTLGSLRERALLALEDLDLLPEDVKLGAIGQGASQETIPKPLHSSQATELSSSQIGLLKTSRQGQTGGISWFEDMIEGSQLGQHSKRRTGHGQSADGSTTIQWEVSEYHGVDDHDTVQMLGAKRKAGDIETDDTAMKE